MKWWVAAALCLIAPLQALSQSPPPIDETVPPASNDYALGPDSKPQPGVAAGKTFSFELNDSKIFPGTTRNITVYVPAAYTADKPACVYVGLDGLGFNAATVFDNLIAQHAMPVTVGIGISPGVVPSARPPEDPRFDRSFEFDSRSDRLARFVIEEVLPAVEQHSIRLSNNPNDRAIGGGSTGAIAAFTVAWERPDAFRRVFSSIGTYVGMRGGEQYYVLVRKTEPKPLRIFMQDGVHDEWPGGPEMGDWWMSNLTMNRALEFAGYDVRHVWGAGTHNGAQAAAVFPDAMRWLWRDWPEPVRAEAPGNPVLQSILQPDEQWQVAAEGCAPLLAANPQGQIFYAGGPLSNQCAPSEDALAFAADGKRYLASQLAIKALNLTVRNNGEIYAVTGDQLWLIRSGGEKVKLDDGLKGATGVAFSPDGLWLFVTQSLSRSGLSYRVRLDGTVDDREPFYDFYVPTWADDSGAGSVAMDVDGRAYVATRMGVQVFDRNGRVTAILPLPENVAATSLCFSDDMLYVAAGGKVYRRKMNIKGAEPWAVPVKLPPWGAG
jgi:gluconolactonase